MIFNTTFIGRLRAANLLLMLTTWVFASQAIGQSTVTKDDNEDDLNLTTSWAGGVVPGPQDTAVWDDTVTDANSVSLGANLSWRGIRLTNPGGPVTINPGNVLTLGTGGIDMSAATQNLTINSGLTLNGGQTWNVATGQTLTTGAFTRSGPGTTLVFDRSVNTGTVAATPTLTHGIVGPWAIVRNSGVAANNSANGFTFATVTGGNLTAYTGATALTTTGALGGMPSGGTGTVNYDLSSAGTLGAFGIARNVNTIRYTGSGARQRGNNAADLLTVNGIMNSGTGTFTLGRDAANIADDFSFGILAGVSGELVLAPMSADLTLHSFIRNNGTTAGNVTIVGNNTVNLTGVNTYTGLTTINSGTLHVSGSARGAGSGSINSTSGININGDSAKYLHTSTTASTRAITLNRGTIDGTGTLGAVTVADNASNVVANGNLTGTGTLTLSSLSFAGDATANLRIGTGVGLNVTGALSTAPANGTVTINATRTGWVLGNNNLIGFGSFAGSINDFSLGTVTGLGGRQVANGLTQSGNFIALDVAGDLPVWTGLGGSAWTTAAVNDNTGPNSWATKSGLTQTNFWAGDTPEFNDQYNIGSGLVDVVNRSVDIQGANVSPGPIVFNNSTGNYTLSSSTGHGIIGAASLLKTGSSSLIITNANAYTGSTTINGGTLQLGDGGATGSLAAGSAITIASGANLSINRNNAVAQGTDFSSAPISGAGGLIQAGTGTTLLTATNTFTGDVVINGGTLAAGTGQGSTPTASNLGALQPAANRNIIINNGGTLSLTGGNVLGTGGSTNTLSNLTLVVNEGGLLRSGLDGDGAGWWNKIGATNLNGGTIRIGSGATTTSFQGLALIGNVSVGGTSVSTIENFAASNVASNGVHLGQNAATGQSITFDVADVTGDSASDLNVSTRLLNTSASLTASGLTKTGAGTMTLSATNAYTGATVISGGTLQIGNGVTDGSIATSSGITNNANLGFNLSGTHTYNNAITGTGNLSKTGDGSLTLSNANYSGITTLDGGTLSIAGTIGGVSVGNSATNVFGNATTATLNLSSLTFAGDGTLNLNLNTAPALAVSGALTTTPANGQVTLNATNTLWVAGNNSLITYSSFSGDVSDFTLGTIGGLTGRQFDNGLVDTGSAIAFNVGGDLPVWTGLNGSAWTTAAFGDNSGPNNWATSSALSPTNVWAADTPEFNDQYNLGSGLVDVATRSVNIDGANVLPGLVTFNNSTGDYTLGSTTGHGIAGTASLLKLGTSALNITNNNTYTGLTTISAGTINLSGGLSDTAITVANGANLNATSTGVISGAASLTANGSVVLAGANTYTGATTIGVGGSLQLGDGTTNGSIASTTITNNGALVYNTTGTQSFAHSVTGTGTIAKNGAGTLTLSTATAGPSGGTSVNAGTLIANSAFLNGGSINITSGATLTFTGTAPSTSTVTGSGAILNNTASTVQFTGNHTGFNGTFTHSAAANNSQFNTALSTSANAAYTLTAGELIFAGTGDYTLQMGSLASTGGTIRGGNAAAGTTTLEVGNLNTNTSIAGNLNSGGAKIVALNKVGTGTLTLNGTNAYTGATNVNAGTLAVAGSKTGTGVVNVASGATLNLGTDVANGTVAGAVAMNGTLSGRGSLTGAVTVGDNVANVIANGNGGTGALTFGSLTFGGDATLNLSLGDGPGINVTNALTTTAANGQVTINASKTGWTLGSNNLIGFGSFTGDVSDFTLGTISGLGARQSRVLALSGNNIALNVTANPTTWTGANGNTWTTANDNDNSGATNWATIAGQEATNFWAADAPEFNDTYDLGTGPIAVTNRNVDIQGGNVSPSLVTFNNSNGNYTLSSSTGHGIAGTASLVKSGQSALIITNTNTFTGSTTINDGALVIGDGTTDGSIASSSNITNNSSLVYNLVGSQAYGNVISGTGALSKSGAGTLTLSGANTYQGGTTISGGTVTLTGAGSLGSGTLNIQGGTTLNINSVTSTMAMTVGGGGDIVNTSTNVITGDFSAFSGTYTHNSALFSTSFSSTTATSGNAAYVLASDQGSLQGMIIGVDGTNTLSMGSLSGVAGSLIRGGLSTSLTGTTTLEVGNLNTDTTFAGSITNGATKVLGLTKVGTGTLTMSGTSTYTGATSINAGTLAVNGSLAGAGGVTVANGATLDIGSAGVVGGDVTVNGTLSGTGSLSGSLTINGVHDIGNSPGLQLANNLTYNGSSTFNWDLVGNTTAGRGTNFDAVNGTGTLTFSGTPVSDLVFNFTGSTVDWTDSFWATNQSWSVFEGFTSIVGTPFTIGSISADSNSVAFGGGFTAGGSFNWSVDGGNVLLNYNAVAVPEPSTVAMLGIMGLGAFVHRRRQAKKNRSKAELVS